MEKQTWDPSVKSLTAVPEVLVMMDEKLDWTEKLGDAFLGQQAALMEAVQRLRAKANKEGNLKTTKEQVVTSAPAPKDATTTTTTIIKIVPADPQIVYVPTYNPTVVYGTWPYYAYPPYYYYPPGYVAGSAFFSFSVGVAVGASLWGGCNWGHGDVDIDINRYNNFNRTNIDRTSIGNNAGGWKHDPSHRKGVQYRDAASQQKFGKGRDQSAVQSREAFRGRTDQGRQPAAARDVGGGNRVGADSRAPTAGLGTQARDAGGGNRQAGQGAGAARTSASSFDRGPEAYRGVASGGATQLQSNRGSASRASAGLGGGGRRR